MSGIPRKVRRQGHVRNTEKGSRQGHVRNTEKVSTQGRVRNTEKVSRQGYVRNAEKVSREGRVRDTMTLAVTGRIVHDTTADSKSVVHLSSTADQPAPFLRRRGTVASGHLTSPAGRLLVGAAGPGFSPGPGRLPHRRRTWLAGRRQGQAARDRWSLGQSAQRRRWSLETGESRRPLQSGTLGKGASRVSPWRPGERPTLFGICPVVK